MERKKMLEIRNALYKMTLMGFIVFFAGILFCVLLPNYVVKLSVFFFGVNTPGPVLLNVFSIMETLVILLFLIPALAFHWQYKKKK